MLLTAKKIKAKLYFYMKMFTYKITWKVAQIFSKPKILFSEYIQISRTHTGSYKI